MNGFWAQSFGSTKGGATLHSDRDILWYSPRGSEYASGKKSSETGEVYAPSKTISKLKSTASGRKKLAAANKKKRAATKAGKQHASHGVHKGKKR